MERSNISQLCRSTVSYLIKHLHQSRLENLLILTSLLVGSVSSLVQQCIIYIYISISIYIHTPACIKKTWGGLLLCFLAQSLFFLLLGFCFVGLLLLFLFLLLLLPVSRIHCFSTDTSSSSWWSQHDRSMPHAAFRTCLCPQIALEFCIA